MCGWLWKQLPKDDDGNGSSEPRPIETANKKEACVEVGRTARPALAQSQSGEADNPSSPRTSLTWRAGEDVRRLLRVSLRGGDVKKRVKDGTGMVAVYD